MTGRQRVAARRYAQALLTLAEEAGSAEAVRDGLRAVVRVTEEHAELGALLGHPVVSAEKKRAVVEAVFPSGKGTPPLVARLLVLLAERDRFDLLASIEQSYTALWNANRNVLMAEVVSAIAIEEAQTAALSEAVKQATGRDVELTSTVDARVRGGLQLRMGGRLYDGSVRARLQSLRDRLAQPRF